MNTKVKMLIGIVLFAVFITASIFLYNGLKGKYAPKIELEADSNSSESSSEEEKIVAPDFTVVNGDGDEVKLSDYFGKPIVLNFWASWCPPCKGEMPHFNSVAEEMADEITFLMVDMIDNQRETLEKGKAYIKEHGFTFNVLYDTEQDANMTYGVTAFPTTLFIDKDGNIVTGAQTAIDEKTLRKGIDLIK